MQRHDRSPDRLSVRADARLGTLSEPLLARALSDVPAHRFL